MFLLVAEALAGGGLHIHGQLAGGNAPRAEYGHDQCAEERCFDLLAHGCSFLVQLPDGRACRSGCNESAYACGGAGVIEDASASQNVGAGLCLAAEMVLASCVLNIQRQLAGGNRSRAENSGSHRHQDDVLEFLTHGSPSFFSNRLETEKMKCPSYFAAGCTPVGWVEQNPVVDSRGKAQMQPLLQGLFAPQLPPQEKPFGSLRNWRAESVPAHTTTATIAASNVFLITFLLMIHSPFQ